MASPSALSRRACVAALGAPCGSHARSAAALRKSSAAPRPHAARAVSPRRALDNPPGSRRRELKPEP